MFSAYCSSDINSNDVIIDRLDTDNYCLIVIIYALQYVCSSSSLQNKCMYKSIIVVPTPVLIVEKNLFCHDYGIGNYTLHLGIPYI